MKHRSDRQALALATVLSTALCAGMFAATVRLVLPTHQHKTGQVMEASIIQRPQNALATPQNQ